MTRATDLGIRLTAFQRRALKDVQKMKDAIIRIAGQFDDIDQGICNRCDDMRDAVIEFEREIRGSCSWLGEDAESGDEGVVS